MYIILGILIIIIIIIIIPQGYAVTIFAFGQTGAGKTHTLAGPPDSLKSYIINNNSNNDNDNDNEINRSICLNAEAGIVPRALLLAFRQMNENATTANNNSDDNSDSDNNRDRVEYESRVSICEIYSEQVTDLLEDHDPSVLTVRHSPKKGIELKDDYYYH